MSVWQPPVSFDFDSSRTAAGTKRRSFSLSGLRVQLDGMDDEADGFVAKRFHRYLAEPTETPDLQLTFRREPNAPYLETTGPSGVVENYRMEHAIRGEFLYYATGTSCARMHLSSGTGIVLVRDRRGDLVRTDPIHLTIENLLRACLAWVVLLRGGFMLHAASVVRGGRCYLFFGNSGSGKSTISAICGGQVISDDLTMMLPGKAGFEAIGSPFRGTYTACDDLTERYPVAGAFRLRKAPVPSVRPMPRGVAFADFVANLPFVVGEIDGHPAAWDLISSAFAKIPVFELHFRKDDSFWNVIDALKLVRQNP